MESTASKLSLNERWLEFHKENPKVRIRNAAKELSTTEGEIIASLTGPSVVRLNVNLVQLWKRMPELGYVMVLTRNNDCVHERKGWFSKVHVHGNMGFVAGADIDLRMFFDHWAFGFALSDNAAAGIKKSIQIFDFQGNAVVKIYPQKRTNEKAWEKLIQDFTAENQSAMLELRPLIPLEIADEQVDIVAFQKDWSELKDTHDFFPMLRKHKASRIHALRIGGKFTKKVDNKNAEKLLHDFSASGIPLMVFTGNNGNVQIHTGPIKKIVEIPGWINVMDPEFNLHLRTEPIAECWTVCKPNAETDVHSLECFDKEGNVIVQFFGKRKPGIPEDPNWTKYITGLV